MKSIQYNLTLDASLRGTSDARVRAFAKILDDANVTTTAPTQMGRDIAAACGQLRAETQPKARRTDVQAVGRVQPQETAPGERTTRTHAVESSTARSANCGIVTHARIFGDHMPALPSVMIDLFACGSTIAGLVASRK